MYSVISKREELEDHLISSTYQVGRPCLADTSWAGSFVRGSKGPGGVKTGTLGEGAPPSPSESQPWSLTGTL